jgi:hypothetical protein
MRTNMQRENLQRSEYSRLLRQAIQSSINDRWIPRTRGSFGTIDHCLLCELIILIDSDCGPGCPLQDCSEPNSLYHLWAGAKPGSSKELKAARAIVDFLRSIDVEAWADELVNRGVIERD